MQPLNVSVWILLVWAVLTICLRLSTVALLRWVLLLAEGLLRSWALLILGLLLTVLRVALRQRYAWVITLHEPVLHKSHQEQNNVSTTSSRLQTDSYPLHNSAATIHQRTCRNPAHHMKTADINTLRDLQRTGFHKYKQFLKGISRIRQVPFGAVQIVYKHKRF